MNKVKIYNIAKCLPLLLFLILGILMAAPRFQSKKVTYINITPEEFIARYNRPRSWDDYYEYVGMIGRWHVLEYYNTYWSTHNVMYMHSVRVKADEMPSCFPLFPQKAFGASGDSTDVAHSLK